MERRDAKLFRDDLGINRYTPEEIADAVSAHEAKLKAYQGYSENPRTVVIPPMTYYEPHAQQAPNQVPRPRDPILVEVTKGLEGLMGQLGELRTRLAGGLDRASGPEPKNGEVAGAAPPGAPLVSQIQWQLTELYQLARDLGFEADRLERLV